MSSCIIIARRKQEDIVCLVSECDFERCNAYKWQMNDAGYIHGCVNGKKIQMHHFILGKPSKGYVIDHINGIRHDNQRDNLRYVTPSQNSQNIHRNDKNGYIGIYFNTKKQHWRVYCGHNYLGSFRDEKKAAKQYDIAAMILYGPSARTNGLIPYEDTIGFSIDDIKQIKTYSTETKARLNMQKELRQQQTKETLQSREITRNADGVAYIRVQNTDILVDDDKWYDLMLYKWHLEKGYARTFINKRGVRMHRMLLNAGDEDIVDHINNVRHDNRINNLRLSCATKNAHNRTSKKQYRCVTKVGDSWRYDITKNGVKYYKGGFKSVDEAALAYNEQALFLYGNHAKLNVINVPGTDTFT